MALIPAMTLKEFKSLRADQLRQLQSVEVTADGEYVFTAIIPPEQGGAEVSGVIRTEAEYLGVRANSVWSPGSGEDNHKTSPRDAGPESLSISP
jgi:hypothetical protein